MSRRRTVVLVAVAGVALVAAGCSGNTDEATNIGAHSAQLNFHGKADNGPAYSYIEYWLSVDPSNTFKTPTRNWPAGVEGSFWEKPQHLAEQTDYSFRLCGNDQGKQPICASTKRFTTGRAASTVAEDSSGVVHFTSDPGVNDNLFVSTQPPSDTNPSEYTAYRETFCKAMTCGSHITAGAGCRDGSGPESASVVICDSHDANIKLGDLDDTAEVLLFGHGTMDGGPGNDTLSGNSSLGDTLIGGSGQDSLSGGMHNDTIEARSASSLNPDADQFISCGDGDDAVIADRSDPISAGQNGCEHVYKP